jgi:hypothetical protein
MAKLIYSAITSLDGYIEDEDGKFDWAEPNEEVHTFVNDLERPVGTYLYGRRMYEVMLAWETLDFADQSPFIRDFAEMWRTADKIVYSTTLEVVSSARTRIERDFDPEAVRQVKATLGRTSPWAVPSSPPMRFEPAWSTSAICSSRPSWSGPASSPSPTTSASSSSCWTNAVSGTAWCTFGTAPGHDETATLSMRTTMSFGD